MAEQEIRVVAENLLRSHDNTLRSGQPQNVQVQASTEISHSHSINTITSIRPEYVISEDLFAGQRINGRMSSVRRFFCLFVTFDLLFITLMWLICIMLNGDNVMTALKKQIYHYDMHSSLFDVALLAVLRFIVLILFYGILYMNHWIIVAMSTSIACAFLIAKVFVYDFQSSNQSVFEVLLVLISFVLSWGEVWFLDFRVFPQEYHAQQYLMPTPEAERAPLVRSYVQGLPSVYTESVGNFYSPLGSAEGSINRFQTVTNPRMKYSPIRSLLDENDGNKYKQQGAQILLESWSLLNSNDWKECKTVQSDTVYTMMQGKTKIYKLSGTVNMCPRFLLEELFFNVDRIPTWNPALLESHKVDSVDEYTDICYQISADALKGAVTSRDFVNLRHWGLIDDCYVIACTATVHIAVPRNEKYIRGENGVGCLAMRPIEDDYDKCQFEWVLNTNLKGWLPHFTLDAALVNMMFEYLQNLRQHIMKLNKKI